MSKGLASIKVRQGAVVITIEPDASVYYSIMMAVPKEFSCSLSAGEAIIINNKKFITKDFGKDHSAMMRFKVALQLQVQTYKNELGEQRKNVLLERLSQL